MSVSAYCEYDINAAARRFTLDGDASLEKHLAQICEQVQDRVRSTVPAEKLQGLFLGGDYGRGEGGVLRHDGEDRPYHDLHFYLLLAGNPGLNQGRFGHGLAELGEESSRKVGLQVQISLLSLAQLRRMPVSLATYDLVMGHRWLIGDESLLEGCRHHRHADRIPGSEAARLLLNRCAGLLFAEKYLRLAHFTEANADFVERTHARAKLGFGDLLLVMQGQYHWSCLERRRRLQALALDCRADWVKGVAGLHDQGVEFKLHPFRSSQAASDLRPQQDELVYSGFRRWQYLELWRLNRPFLSARAYAQSPLNKCPETNPFRNSLANLKSFGSRGLDGRLFRSPRQRLFHALALLLWQPDALEDRVLLGLIQRELNTEATTFPELVRAFHTLWCRFS